MASNLRKDRNKGLRVLLYSGRAGGVAFWGRDVGLAPPDGAGPEQLPAQVRAMAHQEAAKAEGGGEMLVSSAGGSDGGGGIRGDWGLHHKEAEYGYAIYCDAADYGTL